MEFGLYQGVDGNVWKNGYEHSSLLLKDGQFRRAHGMIYIVSLTKDKKLEDLRKQVGLGESFLCAPMTTCD